MGKNKNNLDLFGYEPNNNERVSNDEIRQDFINLRPRDGFDLIMADPAWYFKNYSKKGEEKNAISKYECMELEDIQAMPVHLLAAKDCVLWLWCTNPMLDVGIDTLKAWGFKFCTAGSWEKITKNDKQQFGTGYVFRSSNEPVVIGTIGNPKFFSKSERSSFRAKIGEHSEKPNSAFEICERLIDPQKNSKTFDPNYRGKPKKYIELFSRKNRENWVSWGKEVGKLDNRPSYIESLCDE